MAEEPTAARSSQAAPAREPIGNLNLEEKLMRVLRSVLLLGCVAAGAAAQAVDPASGDDRRDVVEVTRGKPVTGRVVNPFGKKELVVMQGGKRVRLERDRVRSMSTVNDHLRDLLVAHAETEDAPDEQWRLVEQARTKQLVGMARVLAYRVLALDPQHAEAHELLGHKKQGEKWLWRRNGQLMPQAKFEEFIADWGHPLELASEHWSLRTNAGIRRATDTLLDLERLYLFMFDGYGEQLDLHEVLRPMPVFAWKDKEAFPGWTELRIPYYYPPLHAEGAYTFFDGQSGRAAALFRVGVESMLNRSLAVDAVYASAEDRLCDWFEIGFGQWIESQLGGEPGRVTAGEPRLAIDRAALVLKERRYTLPNLLTRNVDDHYYDSVTDYKEMDWAYAQAFVAFLMDPEIGHADKLLAYAYAAMRDKKGDSSSTFDKVFGAKIEQLEKPFEAWLKAKAQPIAPVR
jgi:hypothetical protein